MMLDMRDIHFVGVTNHAEQRVRVRGQLYLNRTQMENIRSFITTDFKKSKIDRKMELIPFYSNKTSSGKNGKVFFSDSAFFRYIWKYSPEDKKAVVITVIYK